MRINANLINTIPLSDTCTLLAMQLIDNVPMEKVYIAVFNNSMQIESYEFKLGENFLIDYSYEKIDIYGVNRIEMIADYISNEKGEEILNRPACHFPFKLY